MKPAISEFSFGYAITESIVSQQRSIISGAPIFPTLYEEGQPGGGYDLKLNRSSVPLFLQFKLSHRMIRKNCIERKVHGLFSGAFYRIPLMPLKRSAQHNYLLQLDNGINEVYYVAPFFTEQLDLNQYYSANSVIQNSVFIKPNQIGPFPDNNDHHIALQRTGPKYRFSRKPKIIEDSKNVNILENITSKLKGPKEPIIDTLERLDDQLKIIIGQMSQEKSYLIEEKITNKLDPLNSVTFLSRYFLGCEFLLVTE